MINWFEVLQCFWEGYFDAMLRQAAPEIHWLIVNGGMEVPYARYLRQGRPARPD